MKRSNFCWEFGLYLVAVMRLAVVLGSVLPSR